MTEDKLNSLFKDLTSILIGVGIAIAIALTIKLFYEYT